MDSALSRVVRKQSGGPKPVEPGRMTIMQYQRTEELSPEGPLLKSPVL